MGIAILGAYVRCAWTACFYGGSYVYACYGTARAVTCRSCMYAQRELEYKTESCMTHWLFAVLTALGLLPRRRLAIASRAI